MAGQDREVGGLAGLGDQVGKDRGGIDPGELVGRVAERHQPHPERVAPIAELAHVATLDESTAETMDGGGGKLEEGGDLRDRHAATGGRDRLHDVERTVDRLGSACCCFRGP
ncbi:hypothetical protein GCM10007979_12420 [Nocardioides albus]|nr:hypothetical protein GCM10007979_12420 [Nocardioides albus]